MERAARIAVVGPVPDQLVADLRSLPLRPEVRTFTSLYGDTEQMARFEPDLLITALRNESEEIGALKLLHSLWPTVGVALVTDAESELARGPIAARIGAHLLVYPEKPGHLAAAIEHALQGSDRPRADVFLDLAHGIADEINNPLLFVSGHLQLLRASFDPQMERDRRDQIGAALEGVQRIQASVDRLRLLSQAANGPKRPVPVDLAALLAREVQASPPSPAAAIELPPRPCVVHGDAEHLATALQALVRFRDDLAMMGTPTSLSLSAEEHAVRLRLLASGRGLASWRLPHTFEPYYPNRILRGQGHGLSLFVAQTVVLGHRGQATARRLADGSLQFDFVLPA